MNNNPLVSILLPCYNVDRFLPQCVDSIIGQTYTNLQIVLIDDGSTDRTWQLMQEYANKDTRLEIYHQQNQGVASTRNHLLDKVRGDYVLFVDSDDWIQPNMVEFLLEKSKEKDADIVVCGVVKNNGVCSEAYTEEVMDQNTTIKKFLFHKELNGSLCNKLVKTRLLHNIRFDHRISYGEDALFCWSVLQRVQTVVLTNKQLYHYRMNDNSISHQGFGDKKFSAHIVWSLICKETKIKFPQYIRIALARHCIEDTLLLRNAIHCKYENEHVIRLLQNTIKKQSVYLWFLPITSFRLKVYSFILGHCLIIGKYF